MAADGPAEAVFERFSVERLLSPKSVGSVKRVLKETVKQAGVGAGEEMLTEISNILLDTAILGEDSEFERLVDRYMGEELLSEEEAKQRAYLDQIGRVFWAGAGGALSGGIMGGVVNVVNHQAIKKTNSEYRAMESAGLMRLPPLDKFIEIKYTYSSKYKNLLARYRNLTGKRKWSAVEFNPETIVDHFERHGKGLDVSSEEEYNAAALEFVNNDEDKVSITDDNGVQRFFRASDGLFAVVYPDGTIATFYRPRTGERYWRNQVKKYASKQ